LRKEKLGEKLKAVTKNKNKLTALRTGLIEAAAEKEKVREVR